MNLKDLLVCSQSCCWQKEVKGRNWGIITDEKFCSQRENLLQFVDQCFRYRTRWRTSSRLDPIKLLTSEFSHPRALRNSLVGLMRFILILLFAAKKFPTKNKVDGNKRKLNHAKSFGLHLCLQWETMKRHFSLFSHLEQIKIPQGNTSRLKVQEEAKPIANDLFSGNVCTSSTKELF